MEKSILRSLPFLIIVLVLTYSCKDASLPSGVDSENNLRLEIVVDSTVVDSIIAGNPFEITGSVLDGYGNIVNDILVKANGTEGTSRDGKFSIRLSDLETKGEQSILVTANIDTIDVNEAEVKVFVSPADPDIEESELGEPQSNVKIAGDSLRIGIILRDQFKNEITKNDYNPNDGDAVEIFVQNDQTGYTTDWINENYQSAFIGLDEIGSEEFRLKIGGEEKQNQDPTLIYTVPNVVIINQPAGTTTAGNNIDGQNNEDIQVAIQDVADNLIDQDDVSIHACIASAVGTNPCLNEEEVKEIIGTDTDNGFDTTTGRNGIATFDTINLIRSNAYQLLFFYELKSSGERIYSDLSNEFTIEPAEYSTFNEIQTPQAEEIVGVPIGGDNPPAVQLWDRFENVVQVEGVQITAGLLRTEGNTVEFQDDATTQVATDTNGQAVFENLIIDSAGEYKLTYTIDGFQNEESIIEFVVTDPSASNDDEDNEDGNDDGEGDGNAN